jgi:glyoxylase-like metal-dependent hydrolase (beta-lactamase superfamily II)
MNFIARRLRGCTQIFGQFTGVNADLELQDGMSLKSYGAEVTVIATPGHTPGSISIITPEGDAIIGDVIMGGHLGGALLPTRPNYHYFADDVAQAMTSLDRILAQTAGTLYVGHGGPLTHSAVQAWRQRTKAKAG